jgi:hypothetical protein
MQDTERGGVVTCKNKIDIFGGGDIINGDQRAQDAEAPTR